MNPRTPRTSPRLVRAAAAERGELSRHRVRLLARREDLHAELDQLERALAEVDERLALLDRLAPAAPREDAADRGAEAGGRGAAALGEVTELRGAEVLRGTAIRETAVRILAESGDAARPVHYRRLYELLGEAGFTVTGKDPLATFLTQLSRSPVIRKTTEAGVYELDRDAPDRLRRRLGELQTELREVAGNPSATEDLAALRRRRERILSEVAQVERALEEAARVLPSPSAARTVPGAA